MPNPLTPQVLVDPIALTRALVDIESVSGNEKEIADAVEEVLRERAHLRVDRIGHTVIARTELGREQRVVLAGHLDTVPIADNFPSTMDEKIMWGCGTSDMKSGTALALHLAATVAEPRYDVTYFFYECEEVEAVRNGLRIVAQERPELLTADFAILLEPTYGIVEAGCQGTMRAKVRTHGVRAHAARSWLGDNAIHKAGEALRRLSAYEAREVLIDGCRYREGLNAVRISGGVAGNVIPDECEIEVNFRFAPDRSVAQAEAHLREVFTGYDVEITDFAPGALPGLDAPPAAQFLAATGAAPAAKLGWTDVARFAELGIPALNYGPGDPNLAHKRDEHVELEKIEQGAALLRRWLVG
ncbi:succinyl-diaminopimelate desuccinylase [Catellatospora sp. TT07R-123]|uniref:succinyl-diaminopimelate desuccinylase n=1 Tax=Catellatospora sp. TT07R-123 TaxID=2733863 RepID=UPI001B087ACA|nr:succinyl-diaminopimelate desuccinylase [Catellatospora sp. TT07R-123]GHJ50213.1 succinyl-diaminopimelate desuccinylase [Catellatospora sp. TT07R-123]